MRRASHARAREAFVAYAAREYEALERAERAAEAEENPANGPDYEQGLTAVQRAVLEERARVFAMLWGRRTGKTHTLPRLLLRAVEEPDSWGVYITKTRKNAKLLFWKWLKRAARDLGIAYRTNESDLVLEVIGGGFILLGGADKVDEIEKYRQFGWKLVVVDEMGVYPDDLVATLIDDIIEPATADCDGRIVYSGTPGYALGSRWHELSGDESPIPVHRADARSNTAVPGLWQRILRIKREKGWADDHPTWVREYLGQWVVDASSLIYPYQPGRNAIRGLPTHTMTGIPLFASGWRHVLGVDVGYVHACAFVLVACHELDPHDYIISSEVQGELLPDAFSAVIADYLRQYAGLQVVVDTGGMGKIHAQWSSLRERLPLWAADKRDKPSAIRDLRGRILAGRVKLLDGPQNTALRLEMGKLGWCPKRLHHAEGQPDHACDATLYGLRKLRNLGQMPELGPKPPAADIAERRWIEGLERRAAGNGRAWWDR